MSGMTYKEAAEFAGCSVSTLKRYTCSWCEETALYMLTRGCGACGEYGCDPKKDKAWPPQSKRQLKHEDVRGEK